MEKKYLFLEKIEASSSQINAGWNAWIYKLSLKYKKRVDLSFKTS